MSGDLAAALDVRASINLKVESSLMREAVPASWFRMHCPLGRLGITMHIMAHWRFELANL